MKRTISIFLVALLLVSATLLLAACDGGVYDEEGWNNAIQALEDSQATSIKIVEKEYQNPLKVKKGRTETLAYNGKKGVLRWEREETAYNWLGGHDYDHHDCVYYVLDGSDLKYYRNINSYNFDDGWTVQVIHYDNKEEALQDLHDLYVRRLPYLENIQFNTYNNQHTNGKFEKTSSDNYYDYTYQLQFSNGKLVKIYDVREVNSSLGGTTLKTTTTIKYSAIVSAPKGISNATEVTVQG